MPELTEEPSFNLITTARRLVYSYFMAGRIPILNHIFLLWQKNTYMLWQCLIFVWEIISSQKAKVFVLKFLVKVLILGYFILANDKICHHKNMKNYHSMYVIFLPL